MTSKVAGEVMDGISVIDADTHLTEPHDLWTSRAPRQWVDRVPQVHEVKGRSMWTIDGEVFGNAVGAAVILPDGTKTFGTGFMQLGIDDVHPGASSLEPRLAMMDALGIYAQIVYPNVVGFGGQRFVDVVDSTLKALCATIFNDAMAEFQDGSGGRLFPMAILPWWDLDAAVAEVSRAACARAPGRQHQRRSPEPGIPRSGRSSLGSALGGMCRPRHAGELPHRGQRDVDELARQHAVAFVRRRAQARARLARRDDLELPDHRQSAVVRGARTAPDAAGRLGRERVGVDPVPARGARLRAG